MTDTDTAGPDATFRKGLENGEILLPRCDDCGAFHFFPRILCPHCHGSALTWHRASGRGRVHTTTVVRQRPERGGNYNICMVELEEGVRMMSRVEGIAPEDVAIDMPVTAFVGEADGNRIVLCKPGRD